MIDYNTYIANLDEKLKNYIPPPDKHPPLFDALYKPKDLYRVPLDEAAKLQLNSIKYAFTHHFNNNNFYHNFCKEHNFKPDDINKNEDLDKIPLIPDKFFKDYPSGKDFATWLGNIFTGELPKIIITQKNPTYDEVIDAFNQAGLIVTYSSGTGGRHTFIPRDKSTFATSEYAIAKSLISMIYPLWQYEAAGYVMMPNPKINFIYAGKALEIIYDAIRNVEVAIDKKVTTQLIGMVMGGKGGVKGKFVRFASARKSMKMIDDIIQWLIQREKIDEPTLLVGAPYLIYFVMEKMKQKGITLNFGEKGGIGTGGGWKIHEHSRMTTADFRKEVKEVLGIPEKFCLDVYGMVEGNGWMVNCPEGHYLHAPYTYYKSLVLNEEFKPIEYGEWGRFAFLDAAALSYPGFIVTGDKVRLLKKCPVCDRPGPVLEPEVKRAEGEDIRGCAEEVRRMLSSDLSK
jgi:phenylacetate-coenzyme A ligase PaaK-like adenylate-forming protein